MNNPNQLLVKEVNCPEITKDFDDLYRDTLIDYYFKLDTFKKNIPEK